MIVLENLYEALKYIGDADVWDEDYDDCIAWCYDDDEDICARCGMEMAKRIDIVEIRRVSYGVEFIADISGFVKQHMEFMHRLSQGFKWPMPDADPENDESVFRGVQIVNAMQAGYATDDEYEAMLKELGA